MEKQQKKLHVIYLGESGFPYGLAAIQKMITVGKALTGVGAKVTVVNRKGKFSPDKPVDLTPVGVHKGINYIYTSGTVYRSKSFMRRNWQKFIGMFQEFAYLRKLRKNGDLDVAIISSHHFGLVCLYLIYSALLRFPVVLNYVEWTKTMEHRRGFWKQIGDVLYDRYLVKRMDAAMPISELLMQHYRELAPEKPALKLPILCDFELFNLPKREVEQPYFLYCGSFSYRKVLDFILDAYKQLPDQPQYKLYLLISGGKKEEYEQFDKEIEKLDKGRHIRRFSNIPYEQLVDLYLNAAGLLIPMRPTLQDAARFPFKIGEYLAAGNPIVTTNFGEIVYYFEDEETALVADEYKPEAFARKMQFIMEHPERAKQIGQNGHELGLREFHYPQFAPKLKAFLQEIAGLRNSREFPPSRPVAARKTQEQASTKM